MKTTNIAKKIAKKNEGVISKEHGEALAAAKQNLHATRVAIQRVFTQSGLFNICRLL
jgi:hypothetical protein